MTSYTLRLFGRADPIPPIRVSAAVLPRVGEHIEKGFSTYKVTSVTHQINALGMAGYATVRAEEV